MNELTDRISDVLLHNDDIYKLYGELRRVVLETEFKCSDVDGVVDWFCYMISDIVGQQVLTKSEYQLAVLKALASILVDFIFKVKIKCFSWVVLKCGENT